MLSKIHGIRLLRWLFIAPFMIDDGTGGGGGTDGDGDGDGGEVDPPPGDGDGRGGGGDPGDSGDPPDESGWDEKTRAYISKLRKESGNYRKRSKTFENQVTTLKGDFDNLKEGLSKALGGKGGEGIDDLTPEQQVGMLNEGLSEAVTQNEILTLAVDHGINKDGLKYFQFLISDKLESLGEGEELDEDDLGALAQEAKAKTMKVGDSGSTSVGGAGDNGGGPPKPEGGSGDVTLDQFVQMSITEKSALYVKNKDQYVALMSEAKRKRLLIQQ